MWSMIVVGSPGSGKSYLATSVACLLDRPTTGRARFSVDNIFFTASDFAKWIAKPCRIGEFCIVDDAGLSLASREAMTKTLKQIAKTFQSCRYLNRGIILTVPSFDMIDRQVRGLINAYAEPTKIDFDNELTIAKFHELETDPRSGTVYHHRPKRLVWEMHPSGYPSKRPEVLNSLAFDKPPEEIVSAYEEKKRLYLNKWNKENAEVISAAENPQRVIKQNRFDYYYPLINNNREAYLKDGSKRKQIDFSKILMKFPTAGPYVSRLIATTINHQLRAEESVS